MRLFLITICVVTSVPLFADLDMKKMQMMVQKIKEPRKNIGKANLNNIVSPFVKVENIKVKEQMALPKETKKQVILEQNITLAPLTLNGTVNHKANLNGEWLKTGERVGRYTIIDVSDGKVKVQRGDKVEELNVNEFRQIIRLR